MRHLRQVQMRGAKLIQNCCFALIFIFRKYWIIIFCMLNMELCVFYYPQSLHPKQMPHSTCLLKPSLTPFSRTFPTSYFVCVCVCVCGLRPVSSSLKLVDLQNAANKLEIAQKSGKRPNLISVSAQVPVKSCSN